MCEFNFNVSIKPLSVNDAWAGRRFKTPEYKKYEKDMLFILPKKKINPNVKLDMWITYRFSNAASDVDNPTKCTIDVLCKKYGFDDRQIYSLSLVKEIVPKGEEGMIIKIKERAEESIKKVEKRKKVKNEREEVPGNVPKPKAIRANSDEIKSKNTKL